MNLDYQRKLVQLHDAGYTIQIEYGPYVTGNVHQIGAEDYDVDDSPYVYSDEHCLDRSLEEVNVSEVKVFQPIDWVIMSPSDIEEQDITNFTEFETEETHEADLDGAMGEAFKADAEEETKGGGNPPVNDY